MQLTMMLAFAGACVVLNLVPGPGMMFILAHGIAGGRRADVVAAAGMASGTAVHTAAAALGLSALLRAAPYALDVVRLVGAVVLVCLAITALRSARTSSSGQVSSQPVARRSLRRTYLSAVLPNLANPKVVLFYLAFVPQFLTSSGWPTAAQILVLGAILVLIGIVMDCAVGVAAGAFSALLLRRPTIQRALKRASTAVFGALAVRLVADNH
ncbi:LysE family translocator [Kribbella sp. NPDC050124]|uniref:LysE family translocator n=1 Tax=Kribbella sp. NPDC050124 TaxID=3364114 RepID=UPI0037B9C9D4